MKSAYEIVLSGGSLADAMHAAARADLSHLTADASSLDASQVAQIGMWSSRCLVEIGVMSGLYVGGVLHIHHTATDSDDRRQLFLNLIQEFDIEKSYAYALMRVFRIVGTELLEDLELRGCFPVASLVALCKESTPREAREEAMTLARSGERITMKRAEEIISQFRADVIPAPKRALIPTAARDTGLRVARQNKTSEKKQTIWEFAGDSINVAITSTSQVVMNDVLGMAHDLRNAVSAFCAEHGLHDEDLSRGGGAA